MAHVPQVVHQALSEFFFQWNTGLCPTLTVKTEENGDVLISSTLIVPADMNDNSFYYPWNSHQRKQSGRNSRRRRQVRRHQTRNEQTSSLSLNCDDSGVQIEVPSGHKL